MELPVRLAPSFAQVEVTPGALETPERHMAETVPCTSVTPSIEIVLPSGVTLRVDARVDDGAQRRMLAVLEHR